MKTNEETTIPSDSSPPQPNEKVATPEDESSKNKFKCVFLGVFISLLVVSVVGFFISKYLRGRSFVSQPLPSMPSPQPPPAWIVESGFLNSGLNEISLEKLEIDDFPNFKNVRGVVHYQDKIWLSGSGALVEFDPKTGSILSFSDPKIGNCDTNLVVVGTYLYVPCWEFTDPSDKSTFSPSFHKIYKVNLETRRVDFIHTSIDDFSGHWNYKVYADGDDVWLATPDGAARISSLTDEVELFQQELGVLGIGFNIKKI
ncbi:hypothetical protein ACFL0Y_00415, partial [Patescibacteria group bacterium]